LFLQQVIQQLAPPTLPAHWKSTWSRQPPPALPSTEVLFHRSSGMENFQGSVQPSPISAQGVLLPAVPTAAVRLTLPVQLSCLKALRLSAQPNAALSSQLHVVPLIVPGASANTPSSSGLHQCQ